MNTGRLLPLFLSMLYWLLDRKLRRRSVRTCFGCFSLVLFCFIFFFLHVEDENRFSPLPFDLFYTSHAFVYLIVFL
jgi:hypothetical protein